MVDIIWVLLTSMELFHQKIVKSYLVILLIVKKSMTVSDATKEAGRLKDFFSRKAANNFGKNAEIQVKIWR